ncbi:MAG: hypothetical protein ACI4JA_00160, partial [Oscillospiraceae bacterium]
MPIIINQIKSSLSAKPGEVIKKALSRAGLSSDCAANAEIYKTSLDARRQNDIHFVHSVFVRLGDSAAEKAICEKNTQLTFVEESRIEPEISSVKKEGRVCIAGFGPAGIFCGLVLAEYGYKPLILEKGEDMDSRTRSVSAYW